eukprot:8454647-Pyramimonas_sp.AAC.1
MVNGAPELWSSPIADNAIHHQDYDQHQQAKPADVAMDVAFHRDLLPKSESPAHRRRSAW